jgi:anti-sigma factor RsiW
LASETQAEMRRFQHLLGLSSETERERLESEFFDDDDAFQEMLTAEDDLIDAYARGELSAKERKQFEERFMTSAQGRERVEFARTLAGPRAEQEVAASMWWPGFFGSFAGNNAFVRVAAVIAVLVVTVGFSWLLFDRSRMNNELRELRAERTRLTEESAELRRIADAERARSAELTAQVQAQRNEVLPPPTQPEAQRSPEPRTTDQFVPIAYTLSPGSVRGGSGTTLAVPQKARSIVLRLNFERPSVHNEYSAVIETADGNAVWRNDSFGSRSNVTGISLPSIPASTLPPGDYVLVLSGKGSDGGFEPVANYSFRISRK